MSGRLIGCGDDRIYLRQALEDFLSSTSADKVTCTEAVDYCRDRHGFEPGLTSVSRVLGNLGWIRSSEPTPARGNRVVYRRPA